MKLGQLSVEQTAGERLGVPERFAAGGAAASRPSSQEPRQRITVNLQKRAYDILVSFDWLKELGRTFREKKIGDKDVFVFTSPRIGKLYYDRVKKSLIEAGFTRVARHDIPDGEKNKNLEEYKACLDALMRNFPDPSTAPLVINLGGGVVGDIGGFAAGSFRRGIPYVQVPTTLLGCVDCGVGGKVGVNHHNVKNIIGMFYQPKLVFADLELLKTLSQREIRSGVAEVIKYGVVCNGSFFEFLEKNISKLISLDKDVLTHVVAECYRIKSKIVEEDELDNRNKRIVLNFGHTVGHALEMAVEPRMTHGEAISVGMIGATRLGVKLGTCSQDIYDRVRNLIKLAGLPTSARKYKPNLDQVMESIKYDKKSVNGSLRFVLPTAIGTWREYDLADEKLVREIVTSCLSGD